MELNDSERKWVRLKWDQIRKAQVLADEASRKWQRLNLEINDFLNRSGETDPLQRTKVKDQNLALKDALNTGNWHARNAERHIHDVNLFLRLKELGLL